MVGQRIVELLVSMLREGIPRKEPIKNGYQCQFAFSYRAIADSNARRVNHTDDNESSHAPIYHC